MIDKLEGKWIISQIDFNGDGPRKPFTVLLTRDGKVKDLTNTDYHGVYLLRPTLNPLQKEFCMVLNRNDGGSSTLYLCKFGPFSQNMTDGKSIIELENGEIIDGIWSGDNEKRLAAQKAALEHI